MPKVSVIVPIYKVEKYIERCAISLFEQTLDDIEFIFVDDCSPDASLKLLHDVMNRYQKCANLVKIVKNEHNKGLAYSRAKGMKIATGEYIISCDSDDWVEYNMYEIMYNKALETNADIVVCNYVEEYGNEKIVRKQIGTQDTYKFINDSSIYQTHWGVCYRLIKSSIIKVNNIYPYDGINCGEDVNVMVRAYYYSKNVVHIDKVLFHYNRVNQNSITKKDNNYQNDQFERCFSSLQAFFRGERKEENFQLFLDYCFFINKRYLLTDSYVDIKKWRTIHPETHRSIFKFSHISWRYKMLLKLLSIGIYSPYLINFKLVKLHLKYLQK